MAITGITNLAELSSNQTPGQKQDAPAAAPLVPTQGGATAAPAGDTFEPSTQANAVQTTAQDAGLFNVSQFALASATAGALSAQTAPAQVTQNTAPEPAAQTPAAEAVAAQAAISQNPQTTAAAPIPSPAATPAPATQTLAIAAPAATTDTTNELQSLNKELLGLGLSNNDIQVVDRVATVAKNYNLAVYADLVQQLKAQAAQQAPIQVQTTKPPSQSKATSA